MERFFDIISSFFALILLSPILLIVCLFLKFTGEGEIFYFQERVGKDGKIFKLFKFATMLKNSPNIGSGTITMKNDPRILPLGGVLRKTKINELPQILNVLFGDMSLIGPRPLTLQTFDAYSEDTKTIIKKVRPGLSGIGSIVFRGEEDIMHGQFASIDFYNNQIAPYKGLLEVWFVMNKNIYIYFISIFLTIWIILFPSSKLIWRIFRDLPKPPVEIKKAINYS